MWRRQCIVLVVLLAVSACESPTSAPPQPAPPFGSLDAPTPEATVTGPTIEIRGWVLDAADPAPSVALSVDGKPLEATIRRVQRKEVCAARPNVVHCLTAKPGIDVILTTGRLADGRHTINLDAKNSAGSVARIAAHQFVVKKKTCLVLSVGEARGLAHIGAIEALKESDIRPDCVVGNSMGSIIGALYASAPDTDLKMRYQRLLATYKQMSLEEAKRRGAVGALIGGLLTGGIGMVLGGVAGAGTIERLERTRFTAALDTVFEQAMIEDVPVPFATSYQTIEGSGMGPYITARKGRLADAVSCSANNVALFRQDILKAKCLDPGTDRPARTPVDEACKTFQPARIIAVNVTGEPSFSSAQMNCDLKELIVPAANVTMEAMAGEGPEFESAYKVGYDTTKRWLSTAGLR
ncbi:MAG: patatin-like phospholipase family protein [Acidobacteria bacterium]|nr:patatin-like phospholipase family protein [Acidobacteriota bacterium]